MDNARNEAYPLSQFLRDFLPTLTKIPALSVDPRAGFSGSASKTDD